MRKSVAMLLVFALLAALCLITFLPVQAESRTIVVPDNYSTITEAIGNASNGDTILVKSGIYTQQTLEINKSLTITSEHVGGATIVLHPPQVPENLLGTTIMVYVHPIDIQADKVKLSGFVLTSDGGTLFANGEQIQITNNKMETWGVVIQGNGSRIADNKMATVTIVGSNQTVTDNYLSGLSVTGSFNLIARNRGRGMTLTGSNNVVNQNSFFVNVGTDGGSVSGILLSEGDHNIISNNTAIGMGTGIAIGYTGSGGSYNIFAGNTVEEAGLWGILMGNGSFNVFYGNFIANNRGSGHDGYGLALGGNHQVVQTNLFFHNTLMNNSRNFGTNWDINGVNSFDNGTEGNYWDDYLTKYPNATEVGHSGIGDTPYWVYSDGSDNYPLLNRPDVIGAIPALPEPWLTLVPIIELADPSLTFMSSSKPGPTATPSPSPTPTPIPSPISTSPPTPIQESTPPPEPEPQLEPEPFPTALVASASVATFAVVGVGLLVHIKKRKR
jgi:nitrous oxidase accessory protein